MRFRLKHITFLGRHFDLTGDERIHLTLKRRQQIDTGLRYMDRDDEAVARFRIMAFQSAWCFPPAWPPLQAVWFLAREGQSFRVMYIMKGCV